MSNEVTQTYMTVADAPLPEPAQRDRHLIELWLHGRSPETQRAYRTDSNIFASFVGKALKAVTLSDLQRFADSLDAPLSLPRSTAVLQP